MSGARAGQNADIKKAPHLSVQGEGLRCDGIDQRKANDQHHEARNLKCPIVHLSALNYLGHCGVAVIAVVVIGLHNQLLGKLVICKCSAKRADDHAIMVLKPNPVAKFDRRDALAFFRV